MDNNESVIADLRKENEELAGRLKEYELLESKSQQGTAAETPFDLIKEENTQLKEQLKGYKKLEEDLMAQRIFERAKKQLIVWLTIGGLVLTLAGFVGFGQVEEYTKQLVSKKVEAMADDRIRDTLLDEGRKQVAALVDQKRTDIEDYATEQVRQIVGLLPLGSSSAQTRSAESQSPLTSATATVVDYVAEMSPVRDEGSEGSAVGFAVAAALEYQLKKKLGRQVIISPRYLYYFARQEGGLDVKSDIGANLKDAIKVLSKSGAVAEEVWPYKAGEFASPPPRTVETAEKYKVSTSRQLKGIDEIKASLQSFGPVVAGITMYQSGMTAASTGVLPDPKSGEQIVGGFPICIVGYDDNRKLFKFKNCWATGWGDKGYGYISYDYARKLLSDPWTFSV